MPRPTIDDDELDLIRMQEEFKTSGEKASVAFTRAAPPTITSTQQGIPEKKKSVFAERMAKKAVDKQYKHMSNSIISDVKEFTFDNIPRDFVVMNTGFPIARHRFDPEFVKPVNQMKSTAPHTATEPSITNIQHSKESEGIHKINVEALNAMTESEIQEAREEITNKIDPKLLAFLRSRTNKKTLVSLESIQPENTIKNEELSAFVKKYIPPSKVEFDKLKWMSSGATDLPLEIDESNPTTLLSNALSAIRFDLQGTRINPISDIPESSGLYHHSQDTAGYTLQELQHLSRSTVSAQRSLAHHVLGFIITNIKQANRMENLNRLESNLVEYFIENSDVVLGFRMALDDEFDSVVASGIQGLVAYFESNGDISEESIDDKLSLIDSRTLGMSRKTDLLLRNIKDDYTFTKKDIHSYSIEEIRTAAENDIILGLYASNMFLRLAYLLDQPDSNSRAILVILCRAARHSSFIGKYLIEIGIVRILVERYLGVAVPFTKNSGNDAYLAYLSIKLICLLCHSTREMCLTICKTDVPSVLAKFLVIPSIHDEVTNISDTIKSEVLNLFTTFTEYKINGHLFDDLRQGLMTGLSESVTRKSWTLFSAYLNYLSAITATYSSSMQVTTQNDSLRPFITLVIKTLSGLEMSDSIEIVNGFREGWIFISRYIDLLSIEATHSFVMFIESQSFVSSANLKALLAYIAHTVTDEKSLSPKAGSNTHYGFWSDSSLSCSNTLLDHSILTSAYSTYLDLIYKCGIRSKKSISTLSTLLVSETMMNTIKLIVTNDMYSKIERTRFSLLAQGTLQLVQTWVKLMSCYEDLTLITRSLLYTSAIWLISNLLPGDEIIVKDLLDFILTTQTQTLESINAQEHIKEIYYMNTFNEKTFALSQSLHNLKPKSRMMLELGALVCLPLGADWMFLPVSILTDEMRMTPKSSGVRIVTREDKSECESDNGKIIACMLQFIAGSHQMEPIASPEKMFVQMCRIYILPPVRVDGSIEVFMVDTVRDNLSFLVKQTVEILFGGEGMTKKKSLRIEDAAGGQAKFYQLYRDLVHQYAAVSFGDNDFGMLLLVPLASVFLNDYRNMFWTELMDVLRGFKQSVSQFSVQFVHKSTPDMDLIYSYAIDSEKINNDNSLLYAIAKRNE